MTLDQILQDIHALDEDLHTFERKYGVLSESFYEAYSQGDEPPDDAWVLDWNMWAGLYEVYLRRRQQYRDLMFTLKQATPLVNVIAKATRREPIPVPA